MKNTIIYSILLSIMLTCSSCQETEEKIYMPVEVWTGRNFHLTEDGLPVSIIWFRADRPYKGFCQAGEIKEVVERLLYPEIAGNIPELPLVLGTRNTLSLFYYKGGKYVSRVAVIEFDIDENGFFLGPRGKTQTLAKLLQDKEESGLGRYAASGAPDEFNTEERINQRIAWEAQYEREQEQKRVCSFNCVNGLNGFTSQLTL
ncbi:MAG TPA: hypothetical protein PK052_11880 [Anaerohalosphaeraceae bacterium]|nr:hypothetical protein [Anaerohalosphaeraceae bacterium]HOM77266.1 hypothetical protein [Anaerohalosphaeraceae bacterium]HPO70810.1 hypothetical protein [Anaerohalosphaeraceae bacterium]HRS72660.1 hypothetical protein [Anaerohalosphaeraceae bacterium]